jgi:hypothetical protein
MPSFIILDALCIVLQCNPDDLIAIDRRAKDPNFALALPKPRKHWKAPKTLQMSRKLPRLGVLTATALPVEIY